MNKHATELYPNHIQIHYGQYKREELYAGCVGNDGGTAALAAYQSALEQAQALNRNSVRQRATEIFDTMHVVEYVTEVLANIRASASFSGNAEDHS